MKYRSSHYYHNVLHRDIVQRNNKQTDYLTLFEFESNRENISIKRKIRVDTYEALLCGNYYFSNAFYRFLTFHWRLLVCY